MNIKNAEHNSRQTPKRDKNEMKFTGITLADILFAKPLPKGDDGLHILPLTGFLNMKVEKIYNE